MKNAPCYACLTHSESCHARCKEYSEWAAALRKERAAARVGKQADAHTKKTIEINCKRIKAKRQVGQR